MVIRFFLSGFFVAMAFFGMDMQHDWMTDILDLAECFDQFFQIVAFLEVTVVEAQSFERIV
ncbi:hypothetical protein SDC9_134479 [bioreactor metagenome]|uniref:Uncharacterized protein n=1 Tax=bioreactor metagenome TaxID=1076179 RepID=A0A645DEW2_9ZZZZ